MRAISATPLTHRTIGTIAKIATEASWCEFNRHVNFGFGFARIHPGEFLAHTTKNGAYEYPYFVINFKDYGRDEKGN